MGALLQHVQTDIAARIKKFTINTICKIHHCMSPTVLQAQKVTFHIALYKRYVTGC